MLTFPVTVALTESPQNANPGAYIAPNGNWYCVSADLNTGIIGMNVSTDQGATWNPVASLGPSFDVATGGYSSAIDGSIIYVVSCTALVVQVSVFDTATDTFGATTATTNGITTDRAMKCYFRSSDGCLIVCGNPLSFRIGGKDRTAWFKFNVSSLAFSAWVRCAQTGADAFDYECIGVVPGAGTDVLLAFWSYSLLFVAGVDRSIYYQALDAADSLGALTAIDTVSDAGLPSSTPAVCSDGTTVHYIWRRSSLEGVINVYDAFAATLTFSALQTITLTGDNNNTAICNSASVGTVAVWDDAHTFLYAVDSGAGFAAPVTLGAIVMNVPQSDSLFAMILAAGTWGLIITPDPSPNGGTLFWALSGSVPSTAALPEKLFRFQVVPFPWKEALPTVGGDGILYALAKTATTMEGE